MNLRGFVRLFTHIQLLPVLENGEETTLIGGQAVMEGVMMRSPHGYCVAVRKPNGELVTEATRCLEFRTVADFQAAGAARPGNTRSGDVAGYEGIEFSATHAIQDETTTENGKKDTKDLGSWAMGLNICFRSRFSW